MEITEQMVLFLYGLKDNNAPIKAIKALRELSRACNYGQTIGLREAKDAIDALRNGGGRVEVALHDIPSDIRPLVRSYVSNVFLTDPPSSRLVLSI